VRSDAASCGHWSLVTGHCFHPGPNLLDMLLLMIEGIAGDPIKQRPAGAPGETVGVVQIRVIEIFKRFNQILARQLPIGDHCRE
jgi:hypothetical protein